MWSRDSLISSDASIAWENCSTRPFHSSEAEKSPWWYSHLLTPVACADAHHGQALDTRLKLLTKDASTPRRGRTDIFCHIRPAATDIMSLAELAAIAWSEAVDVHWEDYQSRQLIPEARSSLDQTEDFMNAASGANLLDSILTMRGP